LSLPCAFFHAEGDVIKVIEAMNIFSQERSYDKKKWTSINGTDLSNIHKHKPLVSILTLVYNHSAFIEQTIDSVLNQTLQNWEWIILDDGSTDGTGEMIRNIKDSRIHYSLQEHTGFDHLTRTYNKALAMCSGDFIALLDGDDYWPEYKLGIQVKSFDDPDTVLSYGECLVINQNGKKIHYACLPEDLSVAHNNPIGSALKKLLVDKFCFMVHPTVMVRKSTLLTVGGFIEAGGIGEDFPTWLRLSLEGKFLAIPRCLGYYRKHPFSVTATQNPIVYFDNEINFLRDFIVRNNQKLENLGFSFDMNELEKHWVDIRMFNNAMFMLKLGSHKNAQSEFGKFLERNSSIKSKIIYVLIILSALFKINLVNPATYINWKLQMFMKTLFAPK